MSGRRSTTENQPSDSSYWPASAGFFLPESGHWGKSEITSTAEPREAVRASLVPEPIGCTIDAIIGEQGPIVSIPTALLRATSTESLQTREIGLYCS